MASLRRSKVLSPDGQTAKFLYTIIKQLDLKAIDWNEVASGLEITNGHAARMRYSRFKAQIEGLPAQSKPRAPRPKKDATTAAKGKGKNKPGYEPGKVDDMKGDGDDDDCDGDVKMEQDGSLGIKEEIIPKIKQEYSVADEQIEVMATTDTVQIKPEPGLMTPSSIPEETAVPDVDIKQEPTTSPSPYPYPLSPTTGLAALKLNPYHTPPPTPTLPVSNPIFSPRPMHSYPNPYNNYATHTNLPPQATVSLADLQLFPIPRPTHQMPLPTFSCPLSPIPMPMSMPMDFKFDFNAPIAMPMHMQGQPPWQPQFEKFRPVSGGGGGGGVKRERSDE